MLEKVFIDKQIPAEYQIVDRLMTEFKMADTLLCGDDALTDYGEHYQELVNATLFNLINNLTQLAWKNFFYNYNNDVLIATRLFNGISKSLTIPRIFHDHDYLHLL